MPRLSLSLLGSFQAYLDKQAITGFQSDKARALLVYLTVEAEQPHRRDRLAGLLWPDWPDANARANLRHALNNLRSILRDRQATPSFFLSDWQTIQFNLASDYTLDVADFRRGMTGLGALERGQADEGVLKQVQQAVGRYTGPFLSGFFLEDCAEFEEWSLLTRERLQQRTLAALRALTTHFRQVGAYGQALGYARQWVEIDALQEEAHCQLMRLLALAGQRSAAMLQFESCRQLLAEELGVEPGAETVALHQQIQTGQLTLPVEPGPVVPIAPSLSPPAPPRHNLPAQTTRFIGRQAELAAVRHKLLEPHVRLLTLTGPGGTGKTRLALRVAAELLDHFPDGVFFISLAPIRDAELVIPTVAEVLGVRESGGRSVLDLIQEFVHDKQLLLVFDNFEHVMRVASLVTHLLNRSPALKIMVTSRTLLRVYGEYHFSVPPLVLPNLNQTESPDRLLKSEACQLFIDRAQAIKADFVITDENALAVAEICGKLDGLPLAIELAAARVRLLSPVQMLAQLSRRLQFLSRGATDLPERHQTLRNTIDWSYRLLAPEEQALFRRLAVFVAGWTLEAAEVVCGVGGGVDVFNGLESLLDKSLIKPIDVSGGSRFVMLETLREYGLERLQASAEVRQIERAYVDYYCEWIEVAAQALEATDQTMWLTQLETEQDNLRAVLRWAQDNHEVERSLRLVGALWRFWEMRSQITEGRTWLEAALTACDNCPLALRAEAFTGAGTMAWHQNDYSRAIALHQAALDLYRSLEDRHGIAFALNNIGCQFLDQGDYAGAVKFIEESFILARPLGKSRVLSYVLHNLGEIARYQRNYERAVTLFEEALALSREREDIWATCVQLVSLGFVRQHLGDYEQATAHIKESLLLSSRLNNREYIAMGLEGFARLLAHEQPERAAQLLGVAEVLREVGEFPFPPSEREEYDICIALVYDALGETVFAAAWTAGRSMTLEQAVAYALEETSASEHLPGSDS